MIKELKGKEIGVVGISGMEGYAAAKFLLEKGAKVIGHDFATKEELKNNFFTLRDYLSPAEREKQWDELQRLNLKLRLKEDYLTDIEKADLIMVSQAWFRYDFNNKLRHLRGKMDFIGILDLYFSFCPAKIIAITGSSGKTTTTQLIYNIVKKEKKALISGNDRDMPPVLDKIGELEKDDYLVLEVSNRQMIGFDYSPAISLITNLFPTHLDDHPTLKAYKYVKQNLIRYQKKSQFCILNYDDQEVLDLEPVTKAQPYYFSSEREPKQGSYLKDNQACWAGEKEPVLDFSRVKLPGQHNQANILAAIVVAKLVRISNRAIREAVYSFNGLAHRIEFVDEREGVKYYEDSQSTNPLSTIAAIKSFKEPIILIAGGKAKPNPEDFNIMAREISETENLKSLLLIGQSAGQIREELDQLTEKKEASCAIFRSLKEAVVQAKKIAKKGEIVLFSPGSESFGEFKDYRERGEKFKELVND